MLFNPFLLAADRAKQSVGEHVWHGLAIAEQSEAIYRELRLIDAELARGRSIGKLTPLSTQSAAHPAARDLVAA